MNVQPQIHAPPSNEPNTRARNNVKVGLYRARTRTLFFVRNAPTCFLRTVYPECGRRVCRRGDRRPRRVEYLRSEFLCGSRLAALPWPISGRVISDVSARKINSRLPGSLVRLPAYSLAYRHVYIRY